MVIIEERRQTLGCCNYLGRSNGDSVPGTSGRNGEESNSSLF